MQQKTVELISYIMTAASNCALYSREHPLVGVLAEKIIYVLEDLYKNDAAALTLLGERLFFNDSPVSVHTPHVLNLKKRMKRKGIERIVLKKGADQEELKGFIEAMASTERGISSPHVSVGVLEMKPQEETTAALIDRNISQTKELFEKAADVEGLDPAALEETIIRLISLLKREQNVLQVVSPVKSYSEYTYVHATNVATLTMFQAEALGLQGEILHEIGVAGLLHDVGKIFIRKEVLEKSGKLDVEEWNLMKSHPVYGARHLASLPDAPKLAVISAYEHHMNFNGMGYPETKWRGHKQHIVSQMVSIADFYDALRTERPYRKAMDIRTVVELMKEESGKIFNPLLVDNFLGALSRIRAIDSPQQNEPR